jgi:hypothetical protein
VSGDRSVLLGVLLYAVIAVAPTALLWAAVRFLPALLRVPELFARLRRRPAPRPVPTGPSFEKLVADLHRLRREVCGRAPTTRVRRTALLAAYDDVLHDLCRATGVSRPAPADLAEREKPFARLQTEAALEAAGVPLDPPRSGPAAA